MEFDQEQAYEWRFLRHFVIRSTGFPFEWMEQLSFPETTACILHTVEMEKQLQEWASSLPMLWLSSPLSPDLRKIKQQIERRVARHGFPLLQGLNLSLLSLPCDLGQWASEWDRRSEAYRAAYEQTRTVFGDELRAKRAQLRRIVADARYQHAIFLSSPDMYYHHMQKYLADFDLTRRTSEVKRMEKHFFKYLQRLCGKNETASFFGPLNYGQIDETNDSFLHVCSSKDRYIRHREVFLTFWAVKALAETMQEHPSLRDQLADQLHPMVEARADGTFYLHSHNQALAVREGRLSTQESTARLRQKGVLRRAFHVPSTVAHPLHALTEQLRALPPSSMRQQWENYLEGWSRWCEEMAQAEFPERIRLLQEGEAAFTAQTGQAARRGGGSMYADRFIFYEETLGHIEQFVMGSAFHDKIRRDLRGALELGAIQGRHEWEYAQRCGQVIFASISPDQQPVPFFHFLQAVREKYPNWPEIPPAPQQAVIERLIADKAARGEEKRVCLSVQELPIADCANARYSLPDLFFAASSLQALERGEFQIVLGKLHHHLLVPNWMTCFYPDVELLRSDLRRYLQDIPAFKRLACPGLRRRNKGFYDFPGQVIEFSEYTLKSAGETIPLYDLQVVRRPGGRLELERKSTHEPVTLYISLADQVRYLPFAMFALPGLAQMAFSLGRHTPRIEIEGVVYQRERWAFASSEWHELLTGDDLETFSRAQRLKQAYALPDWVYIRGSSERKPYLVDLRNFFCVELVCSILKKNEHLLIEEMLPTPQQLWLHSPVGRHSCEFRMNVFKIPKSMSYA